MYISTKIIVSWRFALSKISVKSDKILLHYNYFFQGLFGIVSGHSVYICICNILYIRCRVHLLSHL